MKIDARRIKYVIAREGLIIIVLLLCASASYYGNTWQASKMDSYVNSAKEVKRIINTRSNVFDDIEAEYQNDKISKELNTQLPKGWSYNEDAQQGEYYNVPGIKTQFPKSTPLKVIRSTIDRDFGGVKRFV